MAVFEIQGPDGRVYEIEGADAAGAASAFRGYIGAQTEPTPPAAAAGSATATVPDGEATGAPSLWQLVSGGREAWDRAADAVGRVAGDVGAAVDDTVRMVADGATFGFADEIAAWLGSQTGIGGERGKYDENLAAQREADAAARERAGWAGTAANVIGGVATGGALARAPLIGAVAAPSTAIPLPGRMALGAVSGGAGGALYGFGSGEGADDRTRSAVTGGLVGGAAGGLFPLIADQVAKGMGRFANRGQTAAAEQGLEAAGVPQEVVPAATRALQADGALAPGASVGRGGALLAEAGPNALGQADLAVQRGGPGGVRLQGAVGERVAEGARKVSGALDNTLGKPVGVDTTRDAIRTGSQAARKSAYDAAHDIAVDTTTGAGVAVPDLLARVPKSAFDTANRLMQIEGHAGSRIAADVAEDGTVTLSGPLTVRQVDYITRGLNQLAEAGEGAGALGGQTQLGRGYQNLARDLRNAVKEAVPEYRTALETAADPIRRSQAVDIGTKALSPGVRVDQLARDVRGMTGPEKQAVAQGVRAEIDHRMGNVTRALADSNMDAREAVKALRDLSSRNNRDKLALVVGKDQAEVLFNQLDEAATAFELQANLRANSKTFARQAAERDLRTATAPGFIGELAESGVPDMNRAVTRRLFGRTPAAVQAGEDRFMNAMAETLSKRGGEAQQAATALGAYRAAMGARDATTDVWMEALRSGAPVAGLVTAQRADDARNAEPRRKRRRKSKKDEVR